jgi:hypothetical protein
MLSSAGETFDSLSKEECGAGVVWSLQKCFLCADGAFLCNSLMIVGILVPFAVEKGGMAVALFNTSQEIFPHSQGSGNRSPPFPLHKTLSSVVPDHAHSPGCKCCGGAKSSGASQTKTEGGESSPLLLHVSGSSSYAEVKKRPGVREGRSRSHEAISYRGTRAPSVLFSGSIIDEQMNRRKVILSWDCDYDDCPGECGYDSQAIVAAPTARSLFSNAVLMVVLSIHSIFAG